MEMLIITIIGIQRTHTFTLVERNGTSTMAKGNYLDWHGLVKELLKREVP